MTKQIIIDEERSAAIPAAVAYIVPDLPEKMPLNDTEIEELRKNITLQIQGEAVEIDENHLLPVLMILFDVSHRYCPEMVLKLNSGKRILLFDHQTVPVLRDDDIVSYFTPEFDINEFDKKDYADKIVVNLDFSEDKRVDYFDLIKETVIEACKKIAPCQTAVLSGKAPVLAYLAIQHQLYGKTAEVWYQENQQAKAIKITSNL